MIGIAANFCVCLSLVAGADDGSRLGLADLPAYRAALRAEGTEPAQRVTFQELWNRPDRFLDKPVQVNGKIVLRFRQGAVGEFPPLEEAWVETGGNNLVCLVYPQQKGRDRPLERATVKFTGTYLKRVRYPGGDVEREAPLIVGAKPPVLVGKAPPPEPQFAFHWLDWTIGVLIVAGVVVTLVLQHLRRPPSRQPNEFGPSPDFVSEAEGEAPR